MKFLFLLCLLTSVWLMFSYKRTLHFTIVDRAKMYAGYVTNIVYSFFSCVAFLVTIHNNMLNYQLFPGPYTHWLTIGNGILIAWLVHSLISFEEIFRCEDKQPRSSR